MSNKKTISEGATASESTPASTGYALLAETQRRKSALEAERARRDELERENERLMQEREASMQESYEVAQALRSEVHAKKARIAELEQQLQDEKEDAKRNYTQEVEKLHETISSLKSQHNEREDTLNKRVNELKSELDSVLDFKERKDEVEQEMERLRGETNQLKSEQSIREAELERKYVEQNRQLRQEYQQKLEDMRRSTEEDMDERLDANTRRILEQNRQMANELQKQSEQTESLRQSNTALQNELNKLKRQLSVKTDMESQYATRGSQLNREVKKAKEKSSSLESSLNQALRDKDYEISRATKHAQEQIDASQREAADLKRLLQLRTRELQSIKRLAQEVLSQRSDAERFLVHALEEVRSYMSTDSGRTEQKRSTVKRLPEIPPQAVGTATNLPSADALSEAQRVDVAELSWNEIKKVLRQLLTKLSSSTSANNAGAPTFACMPEHSISWKGGATTSSGAPSLE